MSALKELKSMMRSHACSRCGSCVGLSGGAIEMTDRERAYRPRVVGDLSEERAAEILRVCPGVGFDFVDNTSHFYNVDYVGETFFLGAHARTSIGYATDDEVRSNGASGGIISAVLIYLLESGQIKGAVVSRMSATKPWLSEPFIATTRAEVMAAAMSKYCITSVNEILPEIAAFEGELAFVGIPPQVQGIRLLQRENHPMVRNIKYIFGPFYGNTLHFSSIISFLRTYGEKDYRKIDKLYFRYGEWPGNMRVEMKSGRIIELKKFHANYLIPFHILRNSLYCIDLANEFTDISGGDAWAPVYEERGKGFSMVIARSKAGCRILQEMEQKKLLDLTDISPDESIKMHSHGYDLKKRGAFIRMKLRRMHGGRVPQWGVRPPKISVKRYLMEGIVSSVFLIMGTPLARWAVEKLPPKFIGGMFEKARTRWKKSTHNIKRENL